MRDNMTNSEQLKWILAETGRQIRDFILESLQAPYRLVNEIQYNRVIEKLRKEQLDAKLSNLTDNTLLDRILGTHEIPVLGEDESFQIPVRVRARRLQLIQDIR